MTSTTAKPRQANHDEWLTRWKSNLRRMMADDGKMATPAALTGLGSIGVSGVAVWMLMSQGTVLDQHGEDFARASKTANQPKGMGLQEPDPVE